MDHLIIENGLFTPTADSSQEPAHALRVAVARDEAAIEHLEAEWDALSDGIPFRTWEWMQTWWRHYRSGRRQLFALLVRNEQDELVGVAPWFIETSARQGRVVRFLGSGQVCSDYLALLAHRDWSGPVARCVADYLAGEAAHAWHLLDLSGVEESDAAILQLGQRLKEQGHVVNRESDLSCWRAELSTTWDQYLATLSSSRRMRTRTLLRRAFDSGRAVVHRVETEAQLEQAFAVLIDLHQKRRRSLSQPGCFASAKFTDFHRDIASRFLMSGRLRMSWIELDGRPLAAEYSFAGGDTVYYYQGGFEPELAGESPGWLSLAMSLKLAVEEGYRYYDFLRGDESYKLSWRASARPLVRVRIVGRQSSARVRYATARGAELTKSWVRQVISNRSKSKEKV